jgi:hypothetical protein
MPPNDDNGVVESGENDNIGILINKETTLI